MGLEGAQQLRLGTTLAEDPSLITRTQVQQFTPPCNSNSKVSDVLFWSLRAPAYKTQTHIKC